LTVDVLDYHHVMHQYRYMTKICITQNLLRYDRAWLTYLMCHGPFLVHLVFANEKAYSQGLVECWRLVPRFMICCWGLKWQSNNSATHLLSHRSHGTTRLPIARRGWWHVNRHSSSDVLTLIRNGLALVFDKKD